MRDRKIPSAFGASASLTPSRTRSLAKAAQALSQTANSTAASKTTTTTAEKSSAS